MYSKIAISAYLRVSHDRRQKSGRSLKERTTRLAGSEKSTSIPSPSRLKSSSTLYVQDERPSAS